jgi:hypothetical protein
MGCTLGAIDRFAHPGQPTATAMISCLKPDHHQPCPEYFSAQART